MATVRRSEDPVLCSVVNAMSVPRYVLLALTVAGVDVSIESSRVAQLE
jgi:hypothetical protein